jgi:hypothetical protein
MAGEVLCALTDAILIDVFLSKAQFQFSIGNAAESVQLAVFFTVIVEHTATRPKPHGDLCLSAM